VRAGGGRMTPWDWLAPSTASRTRVSYTGRRGGALVVEFELDALAAGDVLDRHLAERRRLVASQARKIDDGEALGRRLPQHTSNRKMTQSRGIPGLFSRSVCGRQAGCP
jgi:hypothetical protein